MPQKQHIIHGRDNAIVGMDPIPPGRWVYVGDYPADADTTVESPAFQNSWVNAGGGARRLRFRRTNENQTEIAGSVTGGTIGTVVTTIPALYRVTEVEYAVGANDGVIVVWKLDTTGELSVLGSLTFEGGSALTGIFYDIVNTGGSLTVNTTTGDVAFNTSTNDFTVDGDDIRLAANGDLVLSADGDVSIAAGLTRTVQAFVDATGFTINPAALDVYLEEFGTFTIINFNGDPIFRMTDGSPDIHIPVGGNVIADLT